MSLRHTVKSAAVATAIVAAMFHAAASEQPAAAIHPAAPATAEKLKMMYLECDRLAMISLLDTGTAAACSTIYEELKRRVFGGDFHRLWAWSRQQTAVAAAGAEARPD